MSYLICTNARSGSWLLAEAMRSTEVAGRPEEFFNPSLRPLYLRDLGLAADAPADEVFRRMLDAGTTDNGIFGAKVHRMQFGAMLDVLREVTGDKDADEVTLLAGVFPALTLIHHRRIDRVGQALSWYRALATDNWWHVAGMRDVRGEDGITLDVDRVAALERRLCADDAAWTELFARAALPVITSTYEDLIDDREATVRRLVRAVGGPADVTVPRPALVQQSDRTTERWRARYTRAARSRQRAGRAGASIVVVTHDEGANLLRTVAALRRTTPPCTEIVVVDDCSSDGSVEDTATRHPGVRLVRTRERLGVAGARNAGADVASGDVVVFSDAHVQPFEGWLPRLLDALQDPEVAEVAPTVCDMHQPAVRGFGFTWPGLGMEVRWLRERPSEPAEVPFICGCFLAMRRATFDELGGFDNGMVRWGSEDAELSMRVWRHGLRCLVVPDAVVSHLFRPTFGYAVEWEHTLHNMLRLAALHFPPDLLTSTIERFQDHAAFPAAIARLDLTDVQERRAGHERGHTRDGRAFFDRFGIPMPAPAAGPKRDECGPPGRRLTSVLEGQAPQAFTEGVL
ncbi:Stf0 family sulfotransferase [Leekyejoonella antrihumi]|uniref:Stf0 family sulfotransferase n=1 Tax=Leekyejoonella antrihumi TaxID=1660198 RepID=UPI001644478E|nr:Stf0 family sulfotransferase [Leekyejoonella antrihumi]